MSIISQLFRIWKSKLNIKLYSFLLFIFVDCQTTPFVRQAIKVGLLCVYNHCVHLLFCCVHRSKLSLLIKVNNVRATKYSSEFWQKCLTLTMGIQNRQWVFFTRNSCTLPLTGKSVGSFMSTQSIIQVALIKRRPANMLILLILIILRPTWNINLIDSASYGYFLPQIYI